MATAVATPQVQTLPSWACRLVNRPLAIEPGALSGILAASPEELPVAPFEEEEDGRSGIRKISVLGPLLHRADSLLALFGFSNYQTIAKRIDRAANDDSVKAIVLDIDSPGGEVAGVFDLTDKIAKAAERKPVWAIVNESAFSAAYSIASAASRIVVPRTAGVGSIGVVALHVDQSQANRDAGFQPTYIFAGEQKVDGNPHQPLSDRARATWQADVNSTYELFVKTVANNRRISRDRVRATEAGTFVGRDAVRAGLADVVLTAEEALAELKKQVNAGGLSSPFGQRPPSPFGVRNG